MSSTSEDDIKNVDETIDKIAEYIRGNGFQVAIDRFEKYYRLRISKCQVYYDKYISVIDCVAVRDWRMWKVLFDSVMKEIDDLLMVKSSLKDLRVD